MPTEVPSPMPTELLVIALACILLVVQLLAAAGTRTLAYGLDWAAGPRDDIPHQTADRAQRVDRAFHNMRETFPIFVAIALAVVVAERNDAVTAFGAQLYLVARILYFPAYVFHVQFVRSIIWVAAMVGVALMGWPLIAGASS